MEDYGFQDRVIAEQKDLTEKLIKLVAFIAENPVFAGLHRVEQDRMRRQRDAMIAYSDALGERIAGFKLGQSIKG